LLTLLNQHVYELIFSLPFSRKRFLELKVSIRHVKGIEKLKIVQVEMPLLLLLFACLSSYSIAFEGKF